MEKKCIKKKNLVLFYYKELKEKGIEEHLKECSFCSKEYKNIESFLDGIKIHPRKIEEEEIDTIINQIKQKAPFNWWGNFKYNLKNFLFNLKTGVNFYLKPVPVIAFLLIPFLFYPLIKNYFFITILKSFKSKQSYLSKHKIYLSLILTMKDCLNNLPGDSILRSRFLVVHKGT